MSTCSSARLAKKYIVAAAHIAVVIIMALRMIEEYSLIEDRIVLI